MGGGGNKADGTQTIVNEPWSEAKPYYKDLYQKAQDAFNASKPYSGEVYAGLNATQTGALQGVKDAAGNWGTQADATRAVQPAVQAQGDAYKALQPGYNAQGSAWSGLQPQYADTAGIISGLGGGMTYGQDQTRALADKTISGQFMDPNSNPYLKGAVDAAQRETFRNLGEMLPQLAGGQQLNGTYGGDRSGLVMSRAIQDALVQANDQANQIYYGNYANERANQMAAPGLYGQANNFGQQGIGAILQGLNTQTQGVGLGEKSLMDQLQGVGLGDQQIQALLQSLQLGQQANQTQLEGQQITGQAGDQQQQWDQAALNAAIQKWQMGTDFPWQELGNFSSILNGGGFNSSTQTNYIPRSSSIFQGATGGGMLGYQLGQMAGMDPMQMALIASALGGASGY